MVALMDEATPLLHSVGDEESPDVSSVVRDSRSASRAAVCCAIFATVLLATVGSATKIARPTPSAGANDLAAPSTAPAGELAQRPTKMSDEAAQARGRDTRPTRAPTAAAGTDDGGAQCSGNYRRCKTEADCCNIDYACFEKNAHYSQCRPSCPEGMGWACEGAGDDDDDAPPADDDAQCAEKWERCETDTSIANGRSGAPGSCCDAGYSCYEKNSHYSQCRPSCPEGKGWACEGAGPEDDDAPADDGGAQCSENWERCETEADCCNVDYACFEKGPYYSQCRPSCPEGKGWACESAGDDDDDDATCAENWKRCESDAGCCDAGYACFEKNSHY